MRPGPLRPDDPGSARPAESRERRQARCRASGDRSSQPAAAPPEGLFGSFDRIVAGSKRRVIEGLNRAIADSIPGTEDLLLDAAALAETVGLSLWHSPA